MGPRPYACGVFCIFIAFCDLAILNILTGVFVERTTTEANTERPAPGGNGHDGDPSFLGGCSRESRQNAKRATWRQTNLANGVRNLFFEGGQEGSQ